MRTRTILWLFLAAVAISMLAACGGSSGSSPAAPSSTSTASQTVSGSATIVGLVNGGGAGMNVAADGTSARSSVDATGHFQLNGIPSGDVRLRFTASGVNAAATVPQVADQQRVEITVAVSGGTATILADVRGSSDASAEAEGVVTAVTGSCPTLTIMIGASTIKTTAQTTFSGGACTDVKSGVKVDAKGTRQTDGSITAQSVRLEMESGGGDTEMDVDGLVAGLSGSCPALTFMVNATTVKTDATTQFKNGACADVKAGVKVEAEGTRQTDGSLLARSVSVEAPEPQELEGSVTSVNAGAMSFQLSGKTVKVTAQTIIRHGSTTLQFTDIKVGVQVHVKGTADATGAIVASEVNIQNDNGDHGGASGEVEGSVTGAVSGSCPAVTFMVKSTTVTTGALTTYAGGTCADIKTGASVDVNGLVQPNTSIAASSVKFTKGND
jgi:hypothetical protein